MKSDPGWVKPFGLGLKQLPEVVNLNTIPQKCTPKKHKSAGNETLPFSSSQKENREPPVLTCCHHFLQVSRGGSQTMAAEVKVIPDVLQEKDGEARTVQWDLGILAAPEHQLQEGGWYCVSNTTKRVFFSILMRFGWKSSWYPWLGRYPAARIPACTLL